MAISVHSIDPPVRFESRFIRNNLI
jgi:hypothetical protein